MRNNRREDSRKEYTESFKALEVLYLSYFSRLSSKISPIICPIPLAQATSSTKGGVCFSFPSAAFTTCFQQKTQRNYAEPLWGQNFRALSASTFILLGSNSHGSQAGLLNEERPHGQRKGQPGHSCSSHPGEE